MTEEYPNVDPVQPEQLDQEVIISPAQQLAIEALHLKKSAYDAQTNIEPLRDQMLNSPEAVRQELAAKITDLRAESAQYDNQATSMFYMAYDEEMGEEGERYRAGELTDEEKIRYEAERHLDTLRNFIYNGEYRRSNIGKAIHEAEAGKTPIVIKTKSLEEKFGLPVGAPAEEVKAGVEDEDMKTERLERIKKGAKLLENALLSFAASRANQYARYNNLIGTGASAESKALYNKLRAMSPRERQEFAVTNIDDASELYDDLDKQGLIPYAVRNEVRKARKQDPNRRLEQILFGAIDKRYGVNGYLAGTSWLETLRGQKPRSKKVLPDQLFSYE